MYGVVLHAPPFRGESHNQRNTTGEVATTSPPFYSEPHRSHVLCVKAELRTTFTTWSQHHFVASGNPERHMRKASHCGSKHQWSCNNTINATPPERLQHRDEHWTGLGSDWIRIANFVEFRLDADYKSLQNLGSGPDLD